MTLPDIVAACNIIKQKRHTNAKLKRKAIRIDFDNDEELYVRTLLTYYPPTGNVNLIHSICYHWLSFYPTTNQKLRCTNQHALEMLYHRRAYWREYMRNQKKGKRL